MFRESDGKTYTIDDYEEIVKQAKSEAPKGYPSLEKHAQSLMSANSDIFIGTGGDWYDAWLIFLINNGKVHWATSELYEYRKKLGNEESAIWALEAGVSAEEKNGIKASPEYYLLIEDYYYRHLGDNPSSADIQRVGSWYKKAVDAGINPDWMDGAWCALYNESSNKSSGSGNSTSGGCYIATAVYGSYDCPEVWTLRRYRDEKLLQSTFGRMFVKTYYATSPTVVKLFGKTEWFNRFWKGKLNRMVAKLKAEGYDDAPYYDR